MTEKQESQEQEEIIIPSYLERLLLNESERAQRASKLYIATLDKQIDKLSAELNSLVAEKNHIITEGNNKYDEAVRTILKTYGVDEAQIDFNVPDGPAIKVIKKLNVEKQKKP